MRWWSKGDRKNSSNPYKTGLFLVLKLSARLGMVKLPRSIPNFASKPIFTRRRHPLEFRYTGNCTTSRHSTTSSTFSRW